MTEIKRPNYFTSQFLIESDFNDEQKYHKEMRYRHHQSFHTWGVVKGLSVTKTGNNQVSIAAGMAVDNEGREIILVPTDPAPQPLVLSGAGDVYITIEYQEVRDESDKDKTSGIVDQYRRITERPLIKSVGAQPPNDGKVILLAKVEKLADGNFGEPDNNVRTFASAKIADGAITSSKIADGAIGTREIGSNSVTIDKLEPSIRPIASINGVSNPAGNVELVATNAITLVPNTDSKQIAIGESHSVLTDNPHGTTAAQVGALPISGGTLTGALTINGSQRNTQDFTAGPFALPRISGRVSVTGASAELSFTRRNLTAWPVTTAAGDRFVWYSPEGSARLFTEVKGDLLTIDKDGNVGIGTTTPSTKLHVSGSSTVTGGDLILKGVGDDAGDLIFQDSSGGQKGRIWSNPSPGVNGLYISSGDISPDIIIDKDGNVSIPRRVDADLFTGTFTGTFTGRFTGTFQGAKIGYVADQFINNLGEAVEQGDVVVLGDNQTSLYYADKKDIPIPEVDWTETAYDTKVCGIVCHVHAELQTEKDEELGETTSIRNLMPEEHITQVNPGQIGIMAILGAYAYCKVDADIAPIKIGDLLTTSPTKGHAQKVLDRPAAIGAIIGKALAPLDQGKGKIPVMVTLQ